MTMFWLGNTFDLKLISTGEDGIEEMIEDLNANKILYAFIKGNLNSTWLNYYLRSNCICVYLTFMIFNELYHLFYFNKKSNWPENKLAQIRVSTMARRKCFSNEKRKSGHTRQVKSMSIKHWRFTPLDQPHRVG